MKIKEQAFVIGPIGDADSEIRRRADDVFKFIIDPVVRDRGLTVTRSDMDPTPGQVTARLLRSILESRLIIADLTGPNANVYYELGVVHSFAKPVVILVDKTSSLTFDTQNERVIEIKDDGKVGVSEAEIARVGLAKAVDVLLKEGYQPSSIVTEVAGAQSLSALAPQDPFASELSSLGEKIDEILYRLSARERTDRGLYRGHGLLAQPIEDMDLKVRTYNKLKRIGVSVIAELLIYSERDLVMLAGFVPRDIEEVNQKLEELGLQLRIEEGGN